jgi:hypothetical protein
LFVIVAQFFYCIFDSVIEMNFMDLLKRKRNMFNGHLCVVLARKKGHLISLKFQSKVLQGNDAAN